MFWISGKLVKKKQNRVCWAGGSITMGNLLQDWKELTTLDVHISGGENFPGKEHS